MESQFKLVSVGIVAEDKNKGSKFISILLSEALPFFEGNVTTDIANLERKGKDASGKEYSHTLQKGMTIKAEWLGAPNRNTSPNVRKGEKVYVYQAGTTERYFWQETGMDNHLRRAEAVTWSFNASNTPVTENEAPTADKHYSVAVDGEEGHMTIKTTKANNEKAGYTVQLNGKKGHATITDDSGNTFQINSSDGSITCKNKDGSYVTITGSNITISADSNVTVKSPNITLDGTVTVTGNLMVEGTIIGVTGIITTVTSATVNSVVVNSPSCC